MATSFHTGMSGVEERDLKADCSRFTSLLRNLPRSSEMKEIVRLAERRSDPEVCLGWIECILELEVGDKYSLKILKSGSQYLLTGKSCESQAGHNDAAGKKLSNPEYFSDVNEADDGKVYVCEGSKNYVFIC